jgi:uncharacterized phage protein (TIGR01671 family)
MREILFKAKRDGNGEWVEGYYLRDQYHRGGKDIIFYRKDSDWFTVYADTIDPETLCQFTGIYDKNGNKIWENDIVNHNGEYAPVKFGRYCSSFDYGNYNFGFYVDFPEETFCRKELGYWCRKVEVVGNVFDDPELLQEELDE